MLIVVGVVVVPVFMIVYFGIYRPLLSHPDPGDMGELVVAVKEARLLELERLLSEEMTKLIALEVDGLKRLIVHLRRQRAISARLEPVETDVGLFLAFTRRKALKIRKWDPATYSDQEWLLQDVFEKARDCMLVLTFAKVARTLLPWDMERLLQFHREIVMQQVRELMLLFLKLSATYGEWHKENLLAMLDAWELAGEDI